MQDSLNSVDLWRQVHDRVKIRNIAKDVMMMNAFNFLEHFSVRFNTFDLDSYEVKLLFEGFRL